MEAIFTEEYFMKKAIEQAKTAFDKNEVPVGAVIVYKNSVIAAAHNLTETLNDVTAHAEMSAFTSASNRLGAKYLNECTLYVTLEPCVMCAGASYWTQIGKIVYGATDEKRGFSKFSRQILHPKTIVNAGVCKDECSELISDFFKKHRSV
jgi:tRNA(adenine34) deaminase